MKKLTALHVLGCLFFALHLGCRKSPTEESRAFKKPSATEIFNLRSKCADMGAKMLEDKGGEMPILSLNPISFMNQSQVTHYDVETNRCYIEFNSDYVTKKPNGGYQMRTVYDGQTGEVLADITTRSDKTTAFMKDGNSNDLDVVEAKMAELMADDRKK
jgi:hypothetical protein